MVKLNYVKKIKSGLNKSNKKIVTLKELSLRSNLKEDIILDCVSEFEPMIRMYDSYNFRNIEQKVNEYISDQTTKTPKIVKKRNVNLNKDNYNGVFDFILKKMVLPGGIIDKAYVFNDQDLKTLKKLVNAEIKKRKEN